jgi:UDP-N-acetyl-D-glucosamine dehydrogenase
VAEVIAGASTKPFSFLPHFPGCGVGGHCIPVDPYYLIEGARNRGFEHRFLKLAREINQAMPRYTVERLKQALGSQPPVSGTTAAADNGPRPRTTAPLGGVRVALLGLSYKRDIDDLRESPALEILKILQAEGAAVTTFDPYVPSRSTVPALADALKQAAAVVIATDHTVFRALTPESFRGTPVRAIVDGRNCLDHDVFRAAGHTIVGIGR